ncbi:uncharacterized protein LOC119079015 [Bradysia coprophila]|uniref:uncharacterized protein LOC119079015 n=1 Tax=Bradysia coprophila TaxID=38358 RepID=UPI00187D8EA6|nr:uncharacterized protein LOC119079015 [Bradysia coprophila]
MGQPFGQSWLNTSSVYQSPPTIRTNLLPISQPLNVNPNVSAASGLNQSYAYGNMLPFQGAMTNTIMPSRLTAEQIASRHVVKDLPNFSGNPRDWGLFISAYDTANETCGFSNSENLYRLQRSIKGDARRDVENLLLHKDSVPKIIDTLRLLYGLPEHVVETAIQDVEKLPPPKEDDLRSLIKFAMAVQNMSATIQHTGALEHLRNPNLMKSIIGKLPSQHQLNWAFYQASIVNANISHLGDWLYRIAEVASRVVRVTSKTAKRNDASDNNNKNSNSNKSNPFVNSQVETEPGNKSQVETEPVNKPESNVSKNDTKKKCPACSSNKCTKLENCKKFKDANRDERWTIVKKGQLCGRCFGLHKYYRCQSSQRCSVDGCKLNHHTLLHKSQPTSEATSNDTKSKDTTDSNRKTCNSQRSKFSQRTDKFRIVPIMLYNKNKKIRDYAYLDEGSNMTTMEESLAEELELTGSANKLCVDWAFGKTHSVVDSRTVTAKISGYFDNAPRFNIANIRTVKHLHLPTQSITNSWLERYQHFKNVPITTYDDAKPRILIGLQYSKLITSMETIEGKDNEPIVCRTRLGWVVQGPTYETDEVKDHPTFSVNMCVCQSNDNELHQLVKEYFTMEHLGIRIPENRLESPELQRARNILDATTVKKGDRYETGLLWKQDEINLPESYNMALKRLECLEAKMERDPALKENLHNQIKQFVEKGYIRKLSTDEIKNCQYPVWYLPTFPVFNPKKPEKVRLVWDGAAKVKGTSLNSKLLVGPDELVPLPELLRRFRERKIAVTGDIAEMYHQVLVRESDQHVQRFLWRESPLAEPDIYVMMVMTFGSTCSPSSAQHVKNKNAKEFQDDYPRAVEAIVNNHYVDDMIDCTDTVDEAEQLVTNVKKIHAAGGFNIRNFTSNSKKLLERIGENAILQKKDLNIGNELGKERVLGMFWNTDTDTFTYSLKFANINPKMISGEYCPTKREVLRVLMSVFDPLGLIANVLVFGKILLQEVWRNKIEWDEKLPLPLHNKWISWIRALLHVEKLHIPRWYSTKLVPDVQNSIQLHTFVDASVEACAATTYLRIENEHGVDCCLVSAKTKVAPTKQLTVPRLELQAAVIGTRLAENVKKSQTFAIDKHVFWTDSQTVMAWINSETRRYNQFVSFRIGEILEVTDPIQWRWVPTKHNVADEATKSKIFSQLDAKSRWFKSPEFLYGSEKSWLSQTKKFSTEEELRPSFVMAMRVIHQEQLIDLNRFSQWNRLVRTQAFVLRFIHNAKNVKQDRWVGILSQEELIRAENKLYQRAQRDTFLDEILVLKHNETASTQKDEKEFERSSELRNLSPYLDEHDILRMKGRIDAATSIAYDTKRPIILPRRHRVTTLLVDSYHRRYKHINHQTALNEIRQKYVIPALRVVMKGIRTSCQQCKNASSKPRIPEMAALPSARLATHTRPFTFTGVDYFGPYPVKVNRSVVQKYGVLFTCLTTRAIHLEVADSLNTNSCINAVIRFSAQKGTAREFFSDNGTNFHGTDNELKKEFDKLDKDKIQQRFTSPEQKWHFIPPTASHMGGTWERLIQTVKNCLKQMLTTKTPNHEMLVTLMAEVENIVNSRPLTYISLDSDSDEALTPNHFLFGSSNAMKPIGETTPRDLNRNDWRALQEMTKHFWHRFVLEYMPDLTKRTKWFKKVDPIKVGDVVLNIDERNPRNTWPKGIVDEVIIAKDGLIRQVVVRFEKNILRRPVSKLAILDVTPPNEEQEVKVNQMESLNGGKNVVQQSKDVNTDLSHMISPEVLSDELTSRFPEEEKENNF